MTTDGQAMFGQSPGGGPPTTSAGVDQVHILWTSEGLSCDGDSVSVTAAMQPSLEDVVLGLLPGLPRVLLHNKVLDPSVGGDDFMRVFHQAANGQLEAPFVLVVEGSIPNEKINGDGYWTSMGNDPATGEPITVNEWIDRLAPGAWAVVAIGTCATYGGIHAMAGNPTGTSLPDTAVQELCAPPTVSPGD